MRETFLSPAKSRLGPLGAPLACSISMAGGRRKTTAGARVGANKAARTQAEPATAEELKTAQMLRTIDELKAQCLAFGLSQDGRKSTLVGRVVRHMRAAATATPGTGASATAETAVVETADALTADWETGKDAGGVDRGVLLTGVKK